MMQQYLRHRFLFEELVKRDFKKKYKRTVLGMAWSLLSPLLMLLDVAIVMGLGCWMYKKYNIRFFYYV